MKKFFSRILKFLFGVFGEGQSAGCPVCGRPLPMQVPLIHICERPTS